MKTTIPEQIETTCDLCGKIADSYEGLYMTLAGSTVENGAQIGPAYKSGRYDLCHSCYHKVINCTEL